jgi:lipopolysaccharide/colanic/teichoic acid biosynthesis glycosyltransferase
MSNNNIKKENHYRVKLFFDGFLLLVAFGLAYFLKRGNIIFEPLYLEFLPLYISCWLIANLLAQKFRDTGVDSHLARLKPYIISLLMFTGLLSLFLFGFKLYDLSRFIVFGSIGIYFFLEVLFLTGIYFPLLDRKRKRVGEGVSFLFFLVEFLLIAASFLASYYYKRGTIQLSYEYIIIFSIICFLWGFAGLVIHKFRIPLNQAYLRTLWPFIKSMFIVVSLVSFFVFGFRIMEFSRLIVFGSLVVFFSFEILIISAVYFYRRSRDTDEPSLDLFKASLLKEQEIIDRVTKDERKVQIKYCLPGDHSPSTLVKKKLGNIYLIRKPEVLEFIDSHIHLDAVDILYAEVIDTGSLYNIEALPQNQLEFFVNLHQLNDFRRINKYLVQVNDKIKAGGIFIGKFLPKEKRMLHFLQLYPSYLANILYFFDFIWKRVFPKLPLLKKIYFAFTRGRNRVVSMAEGLGRLYFCGFELISWKEINQFVYFIAKKVKTPAAETNPSYSPVFKMKRLGKNGKTIYVYKFRTMYPYSEYLQDFVLEHFGYSSIGKPAHDFRVTAWGKFLRRFWLDELPQLINVLKGEMKLVGIRPVSERFMEEFPEDFKQERLKYKPGCIPAYVALLKQSKEGFIEAETVYLQEKEKHPVKTDIKFFFKAIYNIVFNKIRSE